MRTPGGDENGAWLEALGRVLRTLRSDKKLSQEMLARKAMISQAAMSNYESGKRDMSTVVFFNIARALEHEPQVLLDLVSREAGFDPADPYPHESRTAR